MNRYQFLVLLAGLIFSMGLLGTALRRNLLVVMMCLELMLNAVILSFVTFAVRGGTIEGAAMAFFIYAGGACEIALAMAIAVILVKRRASLDMEAYRELKG